MSNLSKKNSKRKTIYAVFAITLILVSGVTIYYFLFSNSNAYTMHGIKETKITNSHSSGGTQTYTFVYENNNWASTYHLGRKLTIHEPLYTNSTEPGTTKLMSVVCNTTGFTLIETAPALPTNVPYAFDVASSTEKINLVFQTPTTPYTGVFEYTMVYDYTLTSP